MYKQILALGISTMILLASLISGMNRETPEFPSSDEETTQTSSSPCIAPQSDPSVSGDILKQ